jgi:hypothetical protein
VRSLFPRLLPWLLPWLLAWAAWLRLGAQPHVLVSVDEEWRFQPAPLSGDLTGWTGWAQEDYPTSDWLTGRSGFGNTPYGEQTLLLNRPGVWRTVLFRREFNVPAPQQFRNLVLRVDYRDGFVAYLNGQEIARRGFLEPPGTPVAFTNVPLPRLAGAAEWISVPLAAGLLKPGPSLLAFQVHSDSDLDRPVFVPELLADFPRGPYLQHVSSNRVTVLWQSARPQPGRLWLGPTDPFSSSPIETASGTNHEVTVTGLLPGHTYRYAVGTGSGADEVRTVPVAFNTLRPSGPLVVQVFGDSGSGSSAQFRLARLLAEQGADLVLHLGDIIYPQITPELSDTRFLSAYRRQMATTPFAFVWGNHDLYAGTAAFRAVIRSSTNDTPAAEHALAGTLPESYFSFDAGDVHFAMVFQPILSQYHLKPDSAQYRWLEADLAATQKPWKILVCHHPRASSGNHRFTDYNANGIPDWIEVGPTLTELARKHGVQLMLAGHDHLYERFLPQGGVHSLTTGGGGAPLYFLRGYVPDSSQFHVGHHYTRLFFDGDTLRVRGVGLNGQNFDGFNIQRAPLPPGRRTANWATPVIEQAPANNGDGNLVSQQYDFYGAPEIKAFTGQFSNLGRARVSLDKTHLYVALEFVIQPDDSDVYVFLEIPGMPGVTTLQGLGNGLPDAAGEGVDALDLLGNLRFEDFRPSVAAVLGDEFADGTDRGFRRPGSTLPLGQGVFRLSPGFPSIPGIRLQQFNRSPQDSAAPPEQSADFIELGIPRTALANLAAGSVIRLGILSARGLNATNRTREIDLGFVGDQLVSSGHGPAVLTGSEVQLPADPDPDDDGLSTTEEIRLGTRPDLADTDTDGLRDGFEVRFRLDPLSKDGIHGATGDPDEDGLDNSQEQALGSDPRDAASPAPPLEWRLGSNRDQQVLSWRTLAGRRYDLQSVQRLTDTWSSQPGFPRMAAGPREEQTVTNEVTSRFFRLRVVP